MCIPRPAEGRRGGEVPIMPGCTTAAACVGWLAESFAGNWPGDAGGRRRTVKKTLALAALAGLAAVAGCSVSAPAPAGPSPSESPTESAGGTPAASPSSSATAGGAKEACELFNSLVADYAAVPEGDSDGYEDVYVQAEDAKDTVTGDLKGLFASLSLLAIDHSAAAESGGKPSQESEDAVRDAVFANAGTCTAEGVTLKL